MKRPLPTMLLLFAVQSLSAAPPGDPVRPNKRRIALLGLALGLLGGIGLLMLHEYRSAPLGEGVLAGMALVALAILSVSVGNLLQATPTARGVPVVPLMAWGMVWGVAFSMAYAIVSTGWPRLDPRPAYLAGIAYLGLAGSALTFPLYSQLLRDWGPGKAAYNSVAVPVVAMALSTLFEGYRWTTLAAGGALLALIGLVVALSGRK